MSDKKTIVKVPRRVGKQIMTMELTTEPADEQLLFTENEVAGMRADNLAKAKRISTLDTEVNFLRKRVQELEATLAKIQETK